MPFKNPAGLYALLALIPFILLYLRRPKPKEKTIPSLMFFMRDRGVTRFANFLKQILRNLLFLVQLAILLSVGFAVASPFFMSEKAASAEETVLVIDSSASMNARLSGSSSTRFSSAVEAAGSMLEGEVSIVLAANIPVVVLERGSANEAKKVLAGLKAGATASHVGDSMLSAGELIEDFPHSRVVVLSDFQANQGTDVIVAKRSLAARGAYVELVNIVGSEAGLGGLSNVGFVGLEVNKFQTTALIRNYDNAQRQVDVEVSNGNQNSAKQQVTLGPRSLEPFSFDTLHGSTTVRISQDDDLSTDNSLFISSPAKKVKALLITNSDTSFLTAALGSSPNIELDVAFPPVVKSFSYDVIIVHNASSQFMLPGFYREINKAVENGAGLVITSQDSLPAYVKQFDLPFSIAGTGNASRASVRVDNYLTKGVDFGVVGSYISIEPHAGGDVEFTSLVVADDGSPLLGVYPKGSGRVFYYGIFDQSSTFKSSYFYPIFWDNLLSFITGSEDIASFNVLTGRVDGISEQRVKTPSGELQTARLFFDDAGFYTVGSKTVAANLLNDEESDIGSVHALQLAGEDSRLLTSGVEAKGEVMLDSKLIFAAVALLFAELLLIKLNGDL